MAHDGTGLSAMSAWRADMLARTTGEAVWIGRLANGEVHLIYQAVRPGNLVQVLDGDSVLPWYACALGHAIAAGLDTEAQEALLAMPAERLTGLTVTRAEDLRQILATTRRRGYAVEAHMATLGDAGIAAPVFDPSQRVVGAIGVVGPAERLLSAERQRILADAVCLAAQGLSQELSAEGAAATRTDPRGPVRDLSAPEVAAAHDFQG
jgi:DNA-binding IclR family transcriptional regulator